MRMRWWVMVLLLSAHVAGAQPAKRAADAHRKQAKALLAKHHPDQAIKELELAVELVPDPDALFDLAQLYDGVPDEAKAFSTYQRVTEGKHAADAQARLAAIIAARQQRAVEAQAKADAEAKAKADEEARRAAAVAAEAARKADNDRRRAEDEDRRRRSAEADAQEAQTRKRAEQRHRALRHP